MMRLWWRQANRVSPSPHYCARLLVAIVLLCAAFIAPGHAQTIDSPAKFAFLIDLSSNTVLMEKQADVPTAPASMSKMMTVLMLLERLEEGTLKEDDTFPVSEAAWRKGGSKMFVKLGSRVSVHDLLRGIIVQSGNDACIVVAEGLAGSEAAFAAEMTARAHELSLDGSSFVNSTGWPDDGHVMSARDLAKLARILIERFPDYYSIFSETSFTYNKIPQANRNPLLSEGIGADGLKTGHTERSGYGLTASAEREGRRLILVMNGLESTSQRAQEAERLLEWGFRSFDSYPLFQADQVVEHAPAWLGDRETVPLVLADNLNVTLSRKARKDMKATIKYDAPIATPIRKGDKVGVLTITAPGTDPVERPLIAGANVSALGPVGRVLGLTQYWLAQVLP
jgi:D-alanyl-D-alanine carboxypeptidase (penicillin-binding protein 5/6)